MILHSPPAVRATLATELDAARQTFADGGDGWGNLERAHVLSQPWAIDHIRVHAVMFRRGWIDRDRVEVTGQLLRLLVAGPGSMLKRYPIGNTGRSRAPINTPAPIGDDDIAQLLRSADQPTELDQGR
jgi:hypothetical protein